MARMVQKSFLFVCLLAFCAVNICDALDRLVPDHARVHKFALDNVEEAVESHTVNKRSTRQKRASTDATCQRQENNLKVKTEDIIEGHKFVNETNFSLALSWAGENDGVIIVAATEEAFGFASESHLYRSTDGGKSFATINDKIDTATIRKNNGLQKHVHKPQWVYVVCHSLDTSGLMYLTKDGGLTFEKIRLAFRFDGDFVFHPLPEHSDKMLVRSSDKDLYLSTDAGKTWTQILENVLNFKWSTMDTEPEAIYAVHDKTSIFEFYKVDNELRKSTNLGKNWLTIKNTIFTFGMQGNFLYASVMKQNDAERIMEVSTDGGKTWAAAQLPSITEDRFYSILDMSEGIIFMHVDNPGDTGHGILYTSDKTGIIFDESLTNHLYPNYVELTDFYKVKSMRGTYLASQLTDKDQSIHTVISFDRGGEWHKVNRPEHVPCKDETKDCNLQIHSQYSQSRGVKANTPLSIEGAPGIILVHGHVADALQTTLPDVYVSSDGGYSWALALNGPHHYQIADQGGLLVAVPSETPTPKVVKFSTDEGGCWHEYTFTDEVVVMTGLLTEPGNKAMSVAIFGYGKVDKQWRSFVIDFEKVIPNECGDVDYTDWVPHESNSDEPDQKGCLLGKKETFKRLKKDSWCKNGHSFEVKATAEFCKCTDADYECDYGYSRSVDQEQCKKDKEFIGPDIDICLRGHEEKLVSTGYRKIPGDTCQGGFLPKSDSLVDLKKLCEEDSKEVVEEDMGIEDFDAQMAHKRERSTRSSFVLVAGLLGTILVVLVVLVFIVRKYRIMKKVPNIRYGTLRNEPDLEHMIDENLGNNTGANLYDDSDSDDHESAQRGGGGVFVYGNKQAPPPAAPASSVSLHTVTVPESSSRKSPPGKPGQNGVPKVKAFHDDSDEDMLQ